MGNQNTKLNSLSDEDLMAIYQDGNEAAFEILYSKYSTKVYGFLIQSLKDRAMADDVFQATFLKVHKSRHQYNSSFPFLAWLFTISKSVMIDYLRNQNTLKEDSNEQALLQAISPEPEEEKKMPDLSYLPEAQRKAIELRYSQELSFDDIAVSLNTSPTNARQLVSRAVKKIKVYLGADHE